MTKPSMTKKVKVEIVMLVTLTLSAVAIWYYFGRPEAGSTRAASSAVAKYKPMGVENPRIHWDRLDEAQQTEYETVGRDIFTGGLPPPSPPPVPIPQPGDNGSTSRPPPPPPPQLPLKYFGYGAAQADSGRRAFLTDGATVYIVAEGDTILGHYRVIKISHANLEFEDMGSARRGVSVIEDQGPAF